MSRAGGHYLPGDFRHQVTIQQPSSGTADGIGGHKNTVATLGTVWAWVQPGKAIEKHLAGGLRQQETITVTIRYPAFTVDDTCSVLWNGRVWRVQGAQMPDSVAKALILTCCEGE